MILERLVIPLIVLAFVLLIVKFFVDWQAIKAKDRWEKDVLRRLSALEKKVFKGKDG